MKFNINIFLVIASMVEISASTGPKTNLSVQSYGNLERRTLGLLLRKKQMKKQFLNMLMGNNNQSSDTKNKSEKTSKNRSNSQSKKSSKRNKRETKVIVNNSFDSSNRLSSASNANSGSSSGSNSQASNTGSSNQFTNSGSTNQFTNSDSNNQFTNSGSNNQFTNSGSNNGFSQQANRIKSQNYQNSCSSSFIYTCRVACGPRSIFTTRTCTTTNSVTNCYDDPGCDSNVGSCVDMYDPSACYCHPISCDPLNYGPGTNSNNVQGGGQTSTNNVQGGGQTSTNNVQGGGQTSTNNGQGRNQISLPNNGQGAGQNNYIPSPGNSYGGITPPATSEFPSYGTESNASRKTY